MRQKHIEQGKYWQKKFSPFLRTEICLFCKKLSILRLFFFWKNFWILKNVLFYIKKTKNSHSLSNRKANINRFGCWNEFSVQNLSIAPKKHFYRIHIEESLEQTIHLRLPWDWKSKIHAFEYYWNFKMFHQSLASALSIIILSFYKIQYFDPTNATKNKE